MRKSLCLPAVVAMSMLLAACSKRGEADVPVTNDAASSGADFTSEQGNAALTTASGDAVANLESLNAADETALPENGAANLY